MISIPTFLKNFACLRRAAMTLAIAVSPYFVIQAEAQYTIYPVPHKISDGNGNVKLTRDVTVVADADVDSYTIERLKEVMTTENNVSLVFANKARKGCSTIWLGVKGSKGKAVRHAFRSGMSLDVLSSEGKYDRHVLSLKDDGHGVADIIIVGEHTNAVFHGLATLEQMLEQAVESTAQGLVMHSTTIYDYADMQYRGIVEGYYGYPYSFDVKKDLMQFFKRYKMNTYLYGAKSDPYHSGYWRDAYPADITPVQTKNGWLSQPMISDLAKLSLETKVNFIWAIHPNSGKAVNFHTADSTAMAVNDVMAKFEKMHALGVRQFAVFLDDAGWDFADVNNYRDFLNNLQSSLEQKYNKAYANPSDTVLPIHYVPHIYAINFANEQQLQTYFNAISQTKDNIVVYTTGSGVWSSLRNADFVKMEQLMKRPVALWWNYPCNDNKDGRLYTSDMYTTLHEMGLPTPETEIPQCLGMVSNPMQQGEVAKICLFGVADYAWNSHAFNTQRNWEDAFTHIVGKENAMLYKYLSLYLRHDDPDYLGTMIDQYKASRAEGKDDGYALRDTLSAIKSAADRMLKMPTTSKSDALLLQDLRPWLLKLSSMTETAQLLMQLPKMSPSSDRDFKIRKIKEAITNYKENRDYQVDALEGMGENPPSEWHPVEPSHKYLMPFIIWLTEQQGIGAAK